MSPDREINADPLGLQTNTDLQSQIALLTKTLNMSVLRSAIALTATLLYSSNLLFAQADRTSTPIVSDKKAFDDTVSPFLSKYCADCHGESSNESGVVLSSISFHLAESSWTHLNDGIQCNFEPINATPNSPEIPRVATKFREEPLFSGGAPVGDHRLISGMLSG